ncbi:MAG: peptidyl-prolyl cis-trans isomerase, EpsD family [Nitrosomonadales bacterium]|nr:peptidyl-prolyl cis-trans isomerase, EpsD family [Nitrosomonadales bacterium]
MSLSGVVAVGNRSRLSVVVALSAGLMMAGCGEHKKAATQVAAKVGSDEITISQVNGVFAKMQPIPGKTAEQAKREVLDNLIDQQLAVHQAIEKKLDRDPVVMQTLEDARRTILARAYLDKIRSSLSNPTAEEVSKYYAAHPELFAQRHVFNMRELDIAVQPGLADTLREQLAKGVAMEAIAADLKAKNIPFTGNASTHAAEETPFEILSKINDLKDGQMTLIEGKNALTVLQVLASKIVPVDEKTATPFIQQYLGNSRSGEEIAKDLKSLKEHTKIEYLGEFLADAGSAAAAPATAGAGKAAEQPAANNIAKAVAGLK